MTWKIKMKYFLALLACFCLWGTTMAQSPEIVDLNDLDNIEAIEIKSTTLRAVNISFLGPHDPGKIKGVVIAPSPLRRAKALELEVVDPNGAVLVSDRINSKEGWGKTLRQYEFELPLPENGVAVGSVLKASVFTSNKLLAFGEKDLPLLSKPQSYVVKDLNVEDEEAGRVLEFVFLNNTLKPVKVVPKLAIKHINVNEGEDYNIFLAGVNVGPKSEKVLSYDLEREFDSGLYEISVAPYSEDKRILAGELKSNFVVEGGFGVISKFALVPTPEAEGANYELVVQGVAEEGVQNVAVNLSAWQDIDGKRKAFREVVEVNVENSGFYASIPLLLKSENSELEGTVMVSTQGTLLAQRSFSFEVEQDSSLDRDPSQPVDEEVVVDETNKLMLLVILGILITSLLVLFYLGWKLYKNKIAQKTLVLLIALSAWQFAYAEALENFWYHPLPGWTYNPTASGQFSTFKSIHFRGNIFNTLTQKGFFQSAPTRIIVKFYQEGGDRLYVESFDYTIEQKKVYKFDLTAPETLDEGDWEIQVYFLMDGTWYVTTWIDEGTGMPNTITFDKTAPSVAEVEFDGVVYAPAERLVRPGIVALESARRTFLLDRSKKRADLKQGALSISDKRDIRRQKLDVRNHKIQKLKDKEILLANQPPGSDTTAIDNQISTLIGEINTLTSQINGITNELGSAVPANSVFATSDLQNDVNLDGVASDVPPAMPADFACPISVGSTAFNAMHLANCASVLNSDIAGLSSQIHTKDGQIRTATGRFKRNSIGVNLVCDDASSGCYAACNPADEICDIDCVENPAACTLYQTNSPVSYADNCTGDPLTCEVDCVDDPDVCRRATFDFSVQGNFCDDSEYCDTSAPKDFQVCDNVGNCSILTDSGVETDWYDPVRPELTASSIIRNKSNIGGTETTIDGQGADALAADDRLTFEITAEDPKNPTAADYPALFDDNACGHGANDDFFHGTPSDVFCSQSNVACALSSNVRGNINQRIGGACSGTCPEGYLLDVNNFCVPQCDYRLFDGCFPFLLIGDTCETSIWLPLESTVPVGQSFIQTSNCGETRTAIGIKPLTESLKHFLDGKDAFGVFFYDTFEDDPSFSKIIYSPDFDLGTAGYGGMTSSPTATATFSHESGFSPAGGNVLKIESQNLLGGYASWQIDDISVDPNKDYILTYWVKTNASVNKDSQGAWIRLTGDGVLPSIYNQYVSSMEGVDSDMTWHRVEIPFTTSSGTNNIDIQLRLEGQNNRVVYYDDIKIFEENWRYDTSQSWYAEPLDDEGDGVCDYMTGDGDGDPRSGLDDRCGKPTFPEKVVVVFTRDGIYIFDVISGSLWMSALQDPNPSNWGRMVFNSLLYGNSYGLNGKIYSTFRFNQGGGKNGAVIVADFINDTIYSHRMNNCFTLAGHKGTGSSYTTYYPSGCSQVAYNWNNFLNDTNATRNSTAYPWSTVMPANLQTATNQLNSMHAQVVGGKTYVAVATNFGVTLLNKTDDTNQHIEFDGLDSSNYTWSHTPSNANIYRRVYIAKDGKLYYLWDYNGDSRTRVWVIDDIRTLPFNSAILSGGSVWDYAIQPNNASNSYPVTALSDLAAALDVHEQESEFLIGADVGIERFKGSLSSGTQHPNLSRSRITRLFAGAPLFGTVLGHWTNGLQDVGGKANDMSSSGNVTVSSVDVGTDLQQFNFDESGYISSSSNDFDVTGDLTIGGWVKTQPGNDDGGYIIAKKDSSNTDFALYRDGSDYLRVDGTTDTTISDYPLNGWNFVVAVWDGANKKTYIDGQLVSVVADAKVGFDAVENLYIGAIASPDFAGGSGTSSDPYQISNISQLQNMQNFLSSHFVLINDIDASDTVNWNSGSGFDPIGVSGGRFSGSFDGNEFVISDLYVNRNNDDYVGLFGFSIGDISNVGLENVSITGGRTAAGGLAGRQDGDTTNVFVSGNVTGSPNYANSSSANYSYTGGVLGDNHGSILNVRALSGTVTGGSARGDRAYAYTGGLVGNCTGSITLSFSEMDVIGGQASLGYMSARGSYAHTGGLAGYSSSALTEVYATGDVTGGTAHSYSGKRSYSYTGGLVGHVPSSASINKAYTTGNVTGGEVTQSGPYTPALFCYTGGIIGRGNATFQNVYATGDVTGGVVRGTRSGDYLETGTGGLIGRGYPGYRSYSLGQVTAGETTGSGRKYNYTGGISGYGQGTFSGVYFLQASSINASLLEDGRLGDLWTDTFGVTDVLLRSRGISTDASENYYQWDSAIWDFGGINDYPVLRGMPTDRDFGPRPVVNPVGGDENPDLNGAVALPFVVNHAYNAQQVRTIYNSTRDWFDQDVKITLQGTSDDVRSVAYGDSGSYFVATAAGITHFDLSGRVIRTVTTAPTSATNVQIVSNDVQSIDYRNGWLIIAYNGRGVEIVNITRDSKEFLPRFDGSIYDPYYFY